MTIVISIVNFFFGKFAPVRAENLREAVCSEVVQILRQERKRKAISMTRLAEKSGLSQSMVSLVERDLRNPTLDTLLRLTDVLELELSDILVRAKAAAKLHATENQR